MIPIFPMHTFLWVLGRALHPLAVLCDAYGVPMLVGLTPGEPMSLTLVLPPDAAADLNRHDLDGVDLTIDSPLEGA